MNDSEKRDIVIAHFERFLTQATKQRDNMKAELQRVLNEVEIESRVAQRMSKYDESDGGMMFHIETPLDRANRRLNEVREWVQREEKNITATSEVLDYVKVNLPE